MWSHSSSSPGGGLLFGASLFKVSALFPVEVDRGTHQQDLLLFYLAMQSFKIDLRPIWKYWLRLCASSMGFPGGSAGKESACNAGDLGLIPGLGRSLGEGKGYRLQNSGLENSMDCIVHGVAKSRTWLSNFHFFHILYSIERFSINIWNTSDDDYNSNAYYFCTMC